MELSKETLERLKKIKEAQEMVQRSKEEFYRKKAEAERKRDSGILGDDAKERLSGLAKSFGWGEKESAKKGTTDETPTGETSQATTATQKSTNAQKENEKAMPDRYAAARLILEAQKENRESRPDRYAAAKLILEKQKENRESRPDRYAAARTIIENSGPAFREAFKDGYDFGDVTKVILGVGGETKLLNQAWNSVKGGYYNARYGEESYDAMLGKANDKQLYEQLLAGDEYQFEAGTALGRGLFGALEQIGQQARQYTNTRTLAMVGTAAGMTALAGNAGPQALVPEEVLTVPTAAAAAFKAGSAISSLEIEAGHAYNEMIDLGISEQTARRVALTVGTANAALDVLQTDELLDAYKAVKGKDATKSVTKLIMEELGKRGLDVAKETVEEVAQEGATIAGAQVASKIDKGEWAYTAKEVGQRLWDTAKSSALTFAMMNTPTAVRNSVNIVKQNAAAGKSQQKTQIDDAATGLTKNEEAVANKVYKDAVAEAEKNGKLSGKDVALEEIGAPIREDIQQQTAGKQAEAEKVAAEKQEQLQKTITEETQKLAEQFAREDDKLRRMTENREQFRRDVTTKLINELGNLKKGVQASPELGELLDHKFEWSALRTALRNVRDHAIVVDKRSEPEATVRRLVDYRYQEEIAKREQLNEQYTKQKQELAERLTGEAQKQDNMPQILKKPPKEEQKQTYTQKMEAKLEDLRTELTKVQEGKTTVEAAYDEKIGELQQRLSNKPSKNSKAAGAVMRQIAKQERLKAEAMKDFDRKIKVLQNRIVKTKSSLKGDTERKDRLELRLEEVNKQFEAEKAALLEEIEDRRAQIRKQAGDKDEFIRKRARELYKEAQNIRKGVRATPMLGELKDKFNDWGLIKQTLLRVEAQPVHRGPKSQLEATIRSMLNEEFNGAIKELPELDYEYQSRLADLEQQNKQERERVRAQESAFTRADLHYTIVENIREAFHKAGLDLDAVLKNAKNLSTFKTVDNTPQRVMEKALGYKEGQILADLTVNKVAQDETKAIQWLNSFTDRKSGILAQISKKYGIKPGSDESAAAQMYAEGFWVNEANEIVPYGDAELAKDFPDAAVQANIKKLARDPQIRQIYDETLDMINASRKRNGYPEIEKLDNYFLHFRAMGDTFSELGLPFNPNDIQAKDLPTDLNGVTVDLKPGQPYFASAQHRKGKRTTFDLLGGLERYLTSAKGQIFHIDNIQTLRALRNYIADMYGQAEGLEGLDELSNEAAQEKIKQVFDSHLSTFAKFLNEEANILAGKTALIDRAAEGIVGRRGLRFLKTLNQQVGSNQIGYSASSAAVNLDAVPRALAKLDKADFVKAFGQMVTKWTSRIDDGFTDSSPVVIRRKGAEQFHRTRWQKLKDPGYWLAGKVDEISTELIARAKYNELTRKGMEPEKAHVETDKWVSRLMGDRSLGQQPQIFNSKALGLLTKYQLEVRNNLDSMFYDTIQEAKAANEHVQNRLERNAKTAAKAAGTIAELAIAQHVFGQIFEKVAGYNPSFDIIEAVAKAFGWDDEEEEPVLDNLEEALLTLAEDLPYSSVILDGGRVPISSALPIRQLFTGKDQYGNEKNRWATLGEAVPYYLIPGGWGQIRKTAKGLSMFDDLPIVSTFVEDKPISGSYTASGNLRYPVEPTPGNILQAAAFGQWANENAREYIEGGRSPIPESQIQAFMESGLTYQQWWERKDAQKKLVADFEASQPIANFRTEMDLTEQAAASIDAGDEDLLREKFLSSAATEISKIKSEMQDLLDFPIDEAHRKKQMQILQEKANQIAEDALSEYDDIEIDGDYGIVGDKVWKRDKEGQWTRLSEEQQLKYEITSEAGDAYYATNGQIHYYRTDDGWKKISDEQLAKQYRVMDTLNITAEEYWGPRKEEFVYAYENPEKYLIAESVGGYYDYIRYKEDMNDISGADEKEKILDYILGLDLSYGEKAMLFKNMYPKDHTFDKAVLKYLNSRNDLTDKQRKSILTELGFELDARGDVIG